MRGGLVAALWFIAAPVLTFAGMALLFAAAPFPHLTILFYRGVLFCALSSLAVFALMVLATRFSRAWRIRDAISAVVFAASINLCFFVIVPVTTDRSISVFILNEMAGNSYRTFTVQQMRDIFTRTYVDGYDQIQRRLEEQRASGNVVESGAGYRITSQGLGFMRFAQSLAGIFHTDERFTDMKSHAGKDNAAGKLP